MPKHQTTILDHLDQIATLADTIGADAVDLHLTDRAIGEIRLAVAGDFIQTVPTQPQPEPGLLGVYRGMKLHRAMPEKLPEGSLVYFRLPKTQFTFNKGVIKDRPAPGLIRFTQVRSAVSLGWSEATAWKESELEVVPVRTEGSGSP